MLFPFQRAKSIQKEKSAVEEINDKLKSSNRLISVLSIVTLLLAGSFIFYLVQSNKKKKAKNKQLENQRAELAQKNEQIPHYWQIEIKKYLMKYLYKP